MAHPRIHHTIYVIRSIHSIWYIFMYIQSGSINQTPYEYFNVQRTYQVNGFLIHYNTLYSTYHEQNYKENKKKGHAFSAIYSKNIYIYIKFLDVEFIIK
jgi:hypothetical protein